MNNTYYVEAMWQEGRPETAVRVRGWFHRIAIHARWMLCMRRIVTFKCVSAWFYHCNATDIAEAVERECGR